MSRSVQAATGPRSLPDPNTPYVRPDVVARLRAFLATGGYHGEVAAAVAAAIIAESFRP